MEVMINTYGVLASTVAAVAVGATWYSMPVFGKTWMKLEKIDENKMKQDAPKSMPFMAILSLVMAYVLAHVAYISFTFFGGDYTFMQSSLMSALFMWLGFVLPVTASNSLFNQAEWKMTIIHAGNWLVTLLAIGFVTGLIGL